MMSAAVLPPRAEVVAEADALAVAGSRDQSAKGAKHLREAADLRVRIWRLERKQTDAAEALDLYRAAADRKWNGACDARVDLALLQNELRPDPGESYRALYLARSKQAAPPCAQRIDAVLDTLGGFKPLPAVLAELDRQTGMSDASASQSDSDQRVELVVPNVDPSAQGRAQITKIERYGAKDAARIVVFVTRPAVFSVGAIPREARGPRIFVDVENTTYGGQANFDVGGVVERVRMGRQKNATRVVLDLNSEVYRKVFYLPEPFRLVIDVSTEPPKYRGAAGGPRPVHRVVLDPGHGGYDPGAVGPSGLREKDVTLDIANRAVPLIARELGIDARLTRETDDFVALEKRIQLANEFHADLFISVHCNASENGSGRGMMTFILDESSDAAAAKIAARENSASAAAADEFANAMSRMQDAESIARSLHFAELLQRAGAASLSPSYEVADQGVRRAGFYVLANAHMPAVLFETAFISDKLGDLRLNTADYRQKIADAIVNTIRAYRDGK